MLTFVQDTTGSRLCRQEMIKDWKFNVQISATDDTPSPPDYDKFTLFHSEVESYAMSQTSLASTNLQKVATLTEEQDMFMPCMGCRLWPWPRVWATLAPSRHPPRDRPVSTAGLQ